MNQSSKPQSPKIARPQPTPEEVERRRKLERLAAQRAFRPKSATLPWKK